MFEGTLRRWWFLCSLLCFLSFSVASSSTHNKHASRKKVSITINEQTGSSSTQSWNNAGYNSERSNSYYQPPAQPALSRDPIEPKAPSFAGLRGVASAKQWLALNGRCFTHISNHYEYKLCPFQNITQKATTHNALHVIMGVWGYWSNDRQDSQAFDAAVPPPSLLALSSTSSPSTTETIENRKEGEKVAVGEEEQEIKSTGGGTVDGTNNAEGKGKGEGEVHVAVAPEMVVMRYFDGTKCSSGRGRRTDVYQACPAGMFSSFFFVLFFLFPFWLFC